MPPNFIRADPDGGMVAASLEVPMPTVTVVAHPGSRTKVTIQKLKPAEGENPAEFEDFKVVTVASEAQEFEVDAKTRLLVSEKTD